MARRNSVRFPLWEREARKVQRQLQTICFGRPATTLLVQGCCRSLQSAQESGLSRPGSARRGPMRHLRAVVLSVVCLALGMAAAAAQAPYPNKTIRVLVPYAPGGLTD